MTAGRIVQAALPMTTLAAMLLAGCQPKPPVTDAGDEARPAVQSQDAASSAPEPLVEQAIAQGDTSGDKSAEGPPSFDCTKAGSESEKLVCSDVTLAAIDRQLADVYAAALARPGADKDTLTSMQRGWVKGRDECWKADDKQRCVRETYLTGLVELQINNGDVLVPTPVEYACNDNSKPFTAVFYNDLDPRAAVLTYGNDQAIVFPERSASGSRYGREGVSFWEHQGGVAVDF